MKKILLLMLSVLVLLSCKDEEPVNQIYLENGQIDLAVKTCYQLKINRDKPTATATYIFSSSNENIATVDDKGFVTAIANGHATISVKESNSEQVATCRINVKPFEVTISNKEITLKPDEMQSLSVTLNPASSINQYVKWETSDEQIVKVNENGWVTAVKSGEAYVSASCGGEPDSCKVMVEYKELVINLETPGTLKEFLNEDISKLTITGNINFVDMFTIRKSDKLIYIDMSKAHIVSYQDNYYSNNENELPKEAFMNSNIRICLLPNDLKSIGESSFKNCKKLIKVNIPQTVRTISNGAFSDCTSLISIQLPNDLGTIESSAFAYTGIKSIIIPPKIKKILSQTFEYSRISSITLPEGLESIGSSAFKGSSIEKLILPCNLKSLGNHTFSNCLSLIEIHSLNPIPPSADNTTFWYTYNLYIPKGSYDKYYIAPGWMEFKNIIEE